MIFETLTILAQQVDDYLGGGIVSIENIAILDSQNDRADEITDNVVMTMLNIEEEATLKNFPNQVIKNNRVQYRNPIVNLNLFILFSANRSTYVKSLSDISKIVAFFQSKKVFTQSNSIYDRDHISLQDINNFKFTVELYTPSFEELNFIWGTLGGRQVPSVLYKLTLVQIERDVVHGQSGTISRSETSISDK